MSKEVTTSTSSSFAAAAEFADEKNAVADKKELLEEYYKTGGSTPFPNKNSLEKNMEGRKVSKAPSLETIEEDGAENIIKTASAQVLAKFAKAKSTVV